MDTLSQHNRAVLKRFVVLAKARSHKIYEDAYAGQWCGNLITAIKDGKRQTWRCTGDTSYGDCYNCSYTGYSCRQCGDNVAKGREFCPGVTCSGMYFNF